MKKRLKISLVDVVILICIGAAIFCLIKFREDKNYYDFKKIKPYLYEISFKDYKEDTELKTLTDVEDFACSSVKNGNFYGRNFDFIYNDVPEFVVKVKAKEGRHASIGIGMISGIHEGNNIEQQYKEKLELLPNAMLDGINDCGVICSDNVVPKEDVEPVTGTNPDGEKLHMSFVVRYVLDNASSADEAIKLLEKRNIYGDVGEHYNLHFMIADKDKTYVVEFIDNKMVAQEKLTNEQIMTNYYVNLPELTENSAGVERYNILQENYNQGNSFDGMWQLMQRVKYSNIYRLDSEINWYSEFLPQSTINNLDSSESINVITKAAYDKMRKDYWDAINNEIRNPANINYWITTHNSIYDIEQRKLRITVQEDYNNYYEYNLDEIQ